jgi:hypothetical protein
MFAAHCLLTQDDYLRQWFLARSKEQKQLKIDLLLSHCLIVKKTSLLYSPFCAAVMLILMFLGLLDPDPDPSVIEPKY